jgi:hypothetical protein
METYMSLCDWHHFQGCDREVAVAPAQAGEPFCASRIPLYDNAGNG